VKDFLSSVRFKILVALLIVLLGFIIASVYSGGTAMFFARLLGMVTTPLQQASAEISGSVGGFFEKYLRAGEVFEENLRLREEINELRGRLVDYERAMHENEQLREILGVMENRQDLKIELASVIARDPADRFYSFSIDKGSVDGVKYLDPVVTADGLVGYVSEVGMTHAKVSTILDVAVDVGAYDSATRDIGIVTGTVDLAVEGLCQMLYLPRESAIVPGDIILTSGGSLYPRDIMVGTVQSVGPNSHGTSLVAVVKPFADVRNVKNVFVITWFEGQGSEND